MAALAQQKPRELLTCAAQGPYRVEAGPYQVAHRLMSGIGNPHRCQLACPVQLGQTGGVPPIRLDPVARPLRDQRGRHDNAFVPERRQLALDAITARPRLIAEPQLDPLLAELAGQPPQRRRRVRDPAVSPHLAPPAAFCDRHDDPVLVNVKPDIRGTIPQDPSPMHEARHRPIRRNPRYLHTVKRVTPSSGGNVV
jgi:hypothetical protein